MTATVLRLKVTLNDVEPKVLRRIEVPADSKLNQLHPTLQKSAPAPNAGRENPRQRKPRDLNPRRRATFNQSQSLSDRFGLRPKGADSAKTGGVSHQGRPISRLYLTAIARVSDRSPSAQGTDPKT